MKVSVIIPTYNEEKVISDCLESLLQQTKKCEIIVVDDGSTDDTKRIVSNFQFPISNFQFLHQIHQGPGAARNMGASKANGDILVFVDADMTFAPDFIEELVKPIEKGETRGTFAKEEMVSNWQNVWARCWNYNQNMSTATRIKIDYPNTAPVFRSILKNEFKKVNGFTEGIGWTDDWSLSQKLGYLSTSTRARCYHHNPDSLIEVFIQSRWIGRNEILNKNLFRFIFNLLRHSFPMSLLIGLFKSICYTTPEFIVFKIIYDTGITMGLVSSQMLARKNK